MQLPPLTWPIKSHPHSQQTIDAPKGLRVRDRLRVFSARPRPPPIEPKDTYDFLCVFLWVFLCSEGMQGMIDCSTLRSEPLCRSRTLIVKTWM